MFFSPSAGGGACQISCPSVSRKAKVPDSPCAHRQGSPRIPLLIEQLQVWLSRCIDSEHGPDLPAGVGNEQPDVAEARGPAHGSLSLILIHQLEGLVLQDLVAL